MSQTKAALTEGSIINHLISLTGPMIIGILGMVAFNLVDTYYIGQLGKDELAAMALIFPVVTVVTSLALGLGVGASVLVSQAIGRNDQAQVQRLTTDSLLLSAVIVAIISAIGVLTIEPVFTLLGATPPLLELIESYMTIWYLSVAVVAIPMVGNNAIRATGDTQTPSVVMLVAVAVNMVLDPIFIFGFGPVPRLELTGAAIATVLSRLITMLFALWVLHYREQMLTFAWPGWTALIESWRNILYIAVPAAGTNIITPISTAFITSLVALQGNTALAAYGIAPRLDMFAMLVVMALSSVLAPFIGQNWGAQRYGRVVKSIRYSRRFTLGWGVLMIGLWFLVGRSVASLFNDDPVVIDNVALYLSIIPIGYGFQGILQMSASALNVLNKPLYASSLIAVQAFGLTIPMAYVGSQMFGLVGIFAAIPIANVLAGIIAFIVLRQVFVAQWTELGHLVKDVPMEI